MPNTTPTVGRKRGFTLIETTLALALTAVGLVALLGLIPHGLEVMKTAVDQSVEARISQEVLNEIQLADWSLVGSYDGQLKFFDAEGVEIEASDPDLDLRLGYVVLIEFLGSGGTGFLLPGNSGGDPDVKRIVVRVANTPVALSMGEFASEEYQDRISNFPSTVVKMGRERD